ncbi:MAG: hypothetical protein ACUVWN_10075 [bacterium]
MKGHIFPADFSKIRTYPINQRKNKVNVTDFASPITSNCSVKTFLDSMPKILAGESFRQLIDAIVSARINKKPVIAMIGGHVIKCGLSPILISLMEQGILTGLAMNGAASIHDFEIAIIGETSEDVGVNIADGKFGMWEETGNLMNSAIIAGCKSSLGMGESLGRKLVDIKAKYMHVSVLAEGFRLSLPITVHVAIGTDIIHQHPKADGAAIGETSFIDFRKFVSEVSELDGGVLLNIGSAVIMPEVFLKALSIARNLGNNVVNFTTANFDMFQHYRPNENVVKRPTNMGGKGYSITGHHEIMIPLLASAVIEKMNELRR